MNYKPGDTIQITNKRLKSCGLTGIIKTEVEQYLGQSYCKVEIVFNGRTKLIRINTANFKKHYPSHNYYNCSDAYEELDNPEDWLNCPNCSLKPKVWIFHNGCFTACGCWVSVYDHFSIRAESIMSYSHRNNKSALNYDWDNLRKNWNHWVKTGEVLFNRAEEYAKTERW